MKRSAPFARAAAPATCLLPALGFLGCGEIQYSDGRGGMDRVPSGESDARRGQAFLAVVGLSENEPLPGEETVIWLWSEPDAPVAEFGGPDFWVCTMIGQELLEHDVTAFVAEVPPGDVRIDTGRLGSGEDGGTGEDGNGDSGYDSIEADYGTGIVSAVVIRAVETPPTDEGVVFGPAVSPLYFSMEVGGEEPGGGGSDPAGDGAALE